MYDDMTCLSIIEEQKCLFFYPELQRSPKLFSFMLVCFISGVVSLTTMQSLKLEGKQQGFCSFYCLFRFEN